MALTPYDRKISDIFKKDGSYDIDFYQREYKWNKDAVNALLDDIFLNLMKITMKIQNIQLKIFKNLIGIT